jgi:large subunit ribosomal protein L22
MYRRNAPITQPVATAKSSIIKGSVQKVNLVLKPIRGKSIVEAISLVSRMRKHAALDVKQTLLSALSNAEQSGHIDIDSLIVKNISAGKAIMLKRFQPRARGRIFGVTKHYSKIYIELHQSEEA